MERVDLPDLVPLEVPDEVPAERHAHTGHLRDRLLDLVLAHVPKPRLPGGEWRLGSIRLGHSHYGDPLTVPATTDRVVDACANFGEALGQVPKWHNMRIYRRLHLTSSESRCASGASARSARRGQSSRLIITRATSSPDRDRRSLWQGGVSS